MVRQVTSKALTAFFGSKDKGPAPLPIFSHLALPPPSAVPNEHPRLVVTLSQDVSDNLSAILRTMKMSLLGIVAAVATAIALAVPANRGTTANPIPHGMLLHTKCNSSTSNMKL